MSIRVAITLNDIQFYGDGSSTSFTIDLSKLPASLAGLGVLEDWSSKVTNLSLLGVGNYSGTGTISGVLSGTKLTVTFSVAPPAARLVPPNSNSQTFWAWLLADAT